MDQKLKEAMERVTALMAELDAAKAKVVHLLDVEPREKRTVRCSKCGGEGHRATTCKENGAVSDEAPTA